MPSLRAAAPPGSFRGVSVRLPTFDGVKVFSTTLARDREGLSDRITRWLRENPNLEVVD